MRMWGGRFSGKFVSIQMENVNEEGWCGVIYLRHGDVRVCLPLAQAVLAHS
jgi:hypothetical protein